VSHRHQAAHPGLERHNLEHGSFRETPAFVGKSTWIENGDQAKLHLLYRPTIPGHVITAKTRAESSDHTREGPESCPRRPAICRRSWAAAQGPATGVRICFGTSNLSFSIPRLGSFGLEWLSDARCFMWRYFEVPYVWSALRSNDEAKHETAKTLKRLNDRKRGASTAGLPCRQLPNRF